MIVSGQALPTLQAIALAFTGPTFRRFDLLMGAALLCTGRRTIANLRRVAAPLATGHITSYQRILSSASWSVMRLACCLCRLIVALLPPGQAVVLSGGVHGASDQAELPGRLAPGRAAEQSA